MPFLLFWTLFGFGAFVLCHLSSHNPRDNPPTNSTFNATIIDHNNRDITSSFEIMLYQEPEHQLSPSNLSDRQAGTTRLINTCPLSSQTFISSSCNFKDGSRGSLQAYTLVCRLNPSAWMRHPIHSTTTRRIGHCNRDEICVMTTSLTTLGGRQGVAVPTAACVDQRAFRKFTKMGRPGQDPGIEQAWAGVLPWTRTRVRAVVSDLEGAAPTELDTLEIEAGKQGVEVEKEVCRDCLDLGTGALPQGTDSLKVEARLLTTGAVAGVLWLAVMSG